MRVRTILGVAAGLIAVAGLSGCSLADNDRMLTLEMVVNAEYTPDSSTNPEEVTEFVCGAGAVDCVEAYSTTEASYLRFDSRQRAAEYASALEDGFVVNYIVMDFAGHIAPLDRQRWAMEALAGTWQDYTGSFPERE